MDLPLALIIQKTLGHGSISRRKGSNAYIYSINSTEGLIKTITLVNGKLKTSKIEALKNLIEWFRAKEKIDFNVLPINIDSRSALNNSSWLAGFIEADGHFSVRATESLKINKVECKFTLSKTYKNGESVSHMFQIAKFLQLEENGILNKDAILQGDVLHYHSCHQNSKNNKKNKIKFSKFTIRTQNLISNEILINYLNTYPMWSSNYLNYKDWALAIDIFKKLKSENILELNNVDSDSNINNYLSADCYAREIYQIKTE